MPNLPTARQSRQSAAPPEPQAIDRSALAHAFLTFTQAAGSLEKSYTQLQNEVGRLRAELERSREDLSRSLEDNARVRAFFARVLEGLPCGVLVTDSKRRPQMLNPEALRLLQLDADWKPGKAAKAPILEQLLDEAGSGDASGDSYFEQEWTSDLLPADRTIGISAAKVEPSAQAESETIWILRDISDQKRLAAEREEARRARALSEIATVLAHEIRNPLGSMELFAGLVGEATAHMPETREWITHLQAGLRSLAATVNNVLEFHSQPCGTLLPTSLDRLLRDTAGFLGPLARQRGLQIVLDNSIGRVNVAADPHRLQQVFFNLSLNSFRAMASGGTLTIRLLWRADLPKGFVQAEFEDQGCGIPQTALGKIFEPGFTTTSGSPGLGLSVCRKVIEQHGGSIRVQSTEQVGTTFTVFLPIAGGIE